MARDTLPADGVDAVIVGGAKKYLQKTLFWQKSMTLTKRRLSLSLRNLDDIGNGPAALILSFILHGNIPYYSGNHHDPFLHSKLKDRPCLLQLTPDLYEHLHTNLRYSTQALPVNVLLDTLLRPNLDTGLNDRTCIEWRYESENAVSHVVLGDASQAGGQWAEEPTSGDWNARALSYAEMLSLPGYTFDKHHQIRTGKPLTPFERPTRAVVADYYATYPKAVGIANAIRNDVHVDGVSRTTTGFFIRSHGIHCKNLVLASGVFKNSMVPPPPLRPKETLHNSNLPLLVVGSGFSAADAIIAAPISRKIIHIFKWSPEDRPSPLRGCHRQAYPEYAGVYRQMKFAAERGGQLSASKSSSFRTKQPKVEAGCLGRDWTAFYEGLPNSRITDVEVLTNSATVKIQLASGESIQRNFGDIAYLIGRTGSLDYLEPSLRTEVLALADRSATMSDSSEPNHVIFSRSFRCKAQEDLQIVPGVFIAGSLTGDSLVRYAFGGCVQVAGTLMMMMNANSHQSRNQNVHGIVSNGTGTATATATADGGLNCTDTPCNDYDEDEIPVANRNDCADTILTSSCDNSSDRISSSNSTINSSNSSSRSSMHSQETQASQITQHNPRDKMSNMPGRDEQQYHDGKRDMITITKGTEPMNGGNTESLSSTLSKENTEHSPSPSPDLNSRSPPYRLYSHPA